MSSLADPLQVEETRIREAYAKRKKRAWLYSCFNPGNLFITQDRERRLLQLLKRWGLASLETKKILEIGCGRGYWLREFVRFGAQPENIAGIDLIPEDVAEAKRLSPPGMRIERGNGAHLEFADERFDVVLQFTVFTSILDSELKRKVAAEMVRVLKHDGLIVWYDFHMNNPWNPDVRGVKKQEIIRLFPNCTVKLQRLTLAPPIARLVAPYSWLACEALEALTCFRTHYLGAIRKRKVTTGTPL
jgi:SAM-dependent methyltransferase